MTIIKDKNLIQNNDRKLASMLYRSEEHNKQEDSMKNERQLQGVGSYSQHDLMRTEDPYKHNHQHPEYTDHIINTMFMENDGYERDRKYNYAQFSKNLLEYFDAGIDFMKNSAPKELFRTSTSKVVALETF